MKIDEKIVNTPLKEYRTKIEWRNIMNYAAAIGEVNQHYFNDENKKGIVAPPMYAVAVTWPIIEHFTDFIDSEDFPVSFMQTAVHYTEYLVLHRPIRPDDELSITGSIASILPHRAGTHCIVRLDAHDSEGIPVFTEYIGELFRGVECTGAGRGSGSIMKIPPFDRSVDPVWAEKIWIDRLRPYIYDGCSRIFFPIHTSVKCARSVGLPDILLQGTATLAYALRIITDKEADSDPYAIKEIYAKFTGMVLPETEIEVQMIGRADFGSGSNLYFEVHTDNEKRAISDGYIRTEQTAQ